MAEITALDALQAFHQGLLSLREGRVEGAEALGNEFLVQVFETELGRFWDKPARKGDNRNAVKSGKVVIDGDEYSINDNFQQDVLTFSDEVELNELESTRCLLESQEDPNTLGRSLLECAIIRFHQQRKYVLDIVRLLLELEGLDDDLADTEALESVKLYVAERLLQPSMGTDATKRIVPRCMASMKEIKAWLQKIGDKIAAAQTLGQTTTGGITEQMETIEFSRVSLMQQHELLGVILCRSIEMRQGSTQDFLDFVSVLQKVDRYDALLVHLIPSIGAYISVFGSAEGGYDLIKARELHGKLFPTDGPLWPLSQLQAAFRAWWLAEYSGFYVDDPPEAAIPPNTDLDEEDRQRSKAFLESLKDGSFDFLLSIAADVKSPDWHDPVRAGMRKWLQRKSPALAPDAIPFADFFQLTLMLQLEVFVDGFISNLPDVLRKLRVEEDEQRQSSQTHEQDLDLERFLLIIAYAYEGRPDAAMNFWSDPDSNLAGFMHWASRRASTPLVTAFCEMLQAISENEECASAAHEFLMDEGHHSSGKMRKSQSLTWAQIFRELDFFSAKIRQKPTPPQTIRYRNEKMSSDQAETEPESAMMLECYLRLMSKLASESETARQFLLHNPNYSLVETLYELASSPIPPRLRGCTFMALRALMARKSLQEGILMWNCLDTWITGGYASHPVTRQAQQSPIVSMDRIFDEISNGFEDPESFIQLLLSLISPAIDSSPLNDGLPFPENLGSASRMPGIEVYVDFVMGLVFATKANDLQDVNQTRVLRLSCLEFILVCLNTFNEDLIIMANETNINVDGVIATTDLATYVRMHPFARVMEWMFNDKVMAALFNTIHQKPVDVGNAAPDSPLILGILRAVEVISKVLDLQATYLELVRPIIKLQSNQRRPPVSNAAFASFEDGLVTRLTLVVDLGNYCGIGHPELTLACLKLLEKMSSSSKITAVWSGSNRQMHRNKAIVALEANGEHEAISRSFVSELITPLETGREADSPAYVTKIYILDFLYQCLQETPRKPTIAHLLLGFKCGIDSLSVDAKGAFASRTSLFHTLLRLLLEAPSGDAQGMRQWLIAIKSRVMRILHILWSSPLSAPVVVEELRENEILFHLLLRETVINPELPWEGENVAMVQFPVTDGAVALIDFLSLRSMGLEYIAMELCSIAQNRMPSVKRRIFEALNGQIIGEGSTPIPIPTIFDLYDFLLPEGVWEIPLPPLQYYKSIDLSACLENDADSNPIYNLERVKEVLLLKRGETQGSGALIAAPDLAAIEREEGMILEYLISSNRQKQLTTQSLKVLKTWTKLLLVMIESNDFKGSAQTSFFLQALQSILPSLEAFASERPDEAFELARLAKVLLFKLDLSASTDDKQGSAIGNLVSDKLFQLFQICLQAIGKWAGTPELRSVYYCICYRYLTGMADQGSLISNRPKTIKTIQVYGERLINVICDDAYGGEAQCQTAALILLNALVSLSHQESEDHVVETLNRLNFIGIMVDSLRNIMQEWHEVFTSGTSEQQNYQNARLALLLELAQTRSGAKYILHSNLFRSLEDSGLFGADPELQINSTNPRALEQHYDLLAQVVRIIGAALVSRGSHNVVQGRKFLTEHRMLVTHTLKRSAGIGSGNADEDLDQKIEELAEGLMVIIAATRFLEFENEALPEPKQQSHGLFH
ncbi:nucleoporin Nup186/Nup192/Nup205 [Fusarium redolens]|uniref:Nucleoporin Nup186/Nup192/Nup205 n=1 Tax=Fusarium redolens TaxID=48865 RepID=A0A9P9GRD2_FUSRE|nr:nucleoporin Nup186/Nup192/Nup205 [Fusarium redolens]KAH7243377.1 nucleoporin Nup186/Nup192/Nup205 [Fusarium redolens]